MKKILRVCFFIWPLLAVSIDSRESIKYPPPKVTIPTELNQVIKALEITIATRSTAKLQEILSKDLKFSNGPTFGQSAITFFNLKESTAESWKNLEVLMSSEGAFMKRHDDTFCYPYIMAHYPEVLNNFPEAYFIPRYPTFLYEYKNTKTKKIAEISYEIVDKLFEKFEEQKSDWVKVKTIDGLTGYVFNKPVDWPSHPLMCLRKQEKTWQIQYLFID